MRALASLLPLALAPIASSGVHASSPGALAAPLGGEWISDCVAIGQNGRHGLIVRLTIRGTKFEFGAQMYGRNTCKTPVVAATYRARIGAVTGSREALQIGLQAQRATMTIVAEDVAATYRQGGNCGLTGWRRGAAMDVSGRTCAPLAFPARGATVTQAARMTEDTLSLSDIHLFSREAAATPGLVLPLNLTFRRTGG